MKNSLFLILGFLVFENSFSQSSIMPASIWIDKPVLRKDTQLIIGKGIKNIKVRQWDIKDDGTYAETFLGIWNVVLKDGKIRWCTWDGTPFITFEASTNKVISKNKISEVIGIQDNQFEMNHTIENGKVTKTTNKRLGKYYENRYFFDWIDYKYDGDRLMEAIYYSKEKFTTKNLAYMKYTFEYK
jgi:hypothetical protein